MLELFAVTPLGNNFFDWVKGNQKKYYVLKSYIIFQNLCLHCRYFVIEWHKEEIYGKAEGKIMVMNFYILFLVSLPEAFLNEIIILLFAGAKERLTLNKDNVVRFIICLVSMLALTSFIRPVVHNVIENILASSIIYIFVFALIYRLRLVHAALSVIFAILLFSTIENSYLPFIVAYVYKGIENFSKNYHLFAIYSIPSRILQGLTILYLWKYEILLVTKISKQFHKTFIISSFLLIFVEYFFGYLFYTYFNVIPLLQQILFAVAIVLLVIIFNYLMFKTIYVAIGKIITNGFTQYKELEENAKTAFELINNLIKSNRNDEAIKIIEGLKCYNEFTEEEVKDDEGKVKFTFSGGS